MKEKCCECLIVKGDVFYEDKYYCTICFMSYTAKEKDKKDARTKTTETEEN